MINTNFMHIQIRSLGGGGVSNGPGLKKDKIIIPMTVLANVRMSVNVVAQSRPNYYHAQLGLRALGRAIN